MGCSCSVDPKFKRMNYKRNFNYENFNDEIDHEVYFSNSSTEKQKPKAFIDSSYFVNSITSEKLYPIKEWNIDDINKLYELNNIPKIKFYNILGRFIIKNNLNFPIRINILLWCNKKYFEYEIISIPFNKLEFYFPIYCILFINYSLGYEQIHESFYKNISLYHELNDSSMVLLTLLENNKDKFNVDRFIGNDQMNKINSFVSIKYPGSDNIEIKQYDSNINNSNDN